MQLAQEETIMIKGKRSKRPRLTSLTMATTTSSTSTNSTSSDHHRVNPISPSNSGELITDQKDDQEDMQVANCLILLAKGRGDQNYSCKTCNKSFASFQALGGHRASHKRPNITKPPDEKNDNTSSGTFLSLQVSNIRSVMGSGVQNKSSRVHECSICGAEFGSGQALGGHMRRHRPIVTNINRETSQEVKRPRAILSLDLNLPAAPELDDDDDDQDQDPREMKFDLFASKEQQVIVFTASPLVDCHY
ncbi:hypothetical protein ACJIZ3_024300 [Penstemon smallii]|uniref:C2H2-type domain-containing protein n=1 Tax=Penstemon smallii TaxID=265156 RepID=A0ABD3TRG0_9LAMI